MRRVVSVLSLSSLCIALVLPVLVRAESPAGRIAVERAQRGAERRRGGLIRHGFHVATRAALAGIVGGGAGYFMGGPATAMTWGTRAAGAGGALSSLTGASRTGIFKHSSRSFAKADLAEAKGQLIRKHFYKVKGIVWSGVESGVMNGLTMGGIGCLTTGPAGVVPAAVTGAAVGAACGVVYGTARAYVVPFFKRRSLGWSMSRAGRALKRLTREPNNPAWQAEVKQQLARVVAKKENLPRLGWGQTRRYGKLLQQAQQLGLRTLASGL